MDWRINLYYSLTSSCDMVNILIKKGVSMDRKVELPKVKDILVKNVIALKPDFTAVDAIRIFNKYQISTAPVVTGQNEVIGYLSETDCIKCLSTCLFFDESRDRTIDHIMSLKILAADIEWDIFELESFFISNHLSSAPVVDNLGHLVGVVSRRDALIALQKSIEGRHEYKIEIKTPIELTMRDRARMIIRLTS